MTVARGIALTRAKERGLRWSAVVVAVALGAAGVVSCAQTPFDLPADVPNDCSVNVSPALNEFLAALPDNSDVTVPSGCYRIDQTLVLEDRHHVVIDGSHAMFRTDDPTGDGSPANNPSKDARTRAHFRLIGGSDITLHSMNIWGANADAGTGDDAYVANLEAQHGIDIEGTENVEIYDVGIQHVYGDFVYFGRDGDTFSSGRVHDSIMSLNGRQGISLTAAHDVTIDHNWIGNTRRATFDLEPNGPSWGVSNVAITDNTIGPGRLLFIASAGVGPVNNITVADNSLEGKPMNIVVRSDDDIRRANFFIVNNITDAEWGTTGPASAMNFLNVDGVQVIGNKQRMQENRGVSGVGATGSTAVNITGNIFVDAISVLQQPVDGAQVCGNRLLQSGPFDEPVPCDAAATQTSEAPADATSIEPTTSVGPTTSVKPAISANSTTTSVGDSQLVGGPQPPGHDGEQLPGDAGPAVEHGRELSGAQHPK